MTVTVVNLMDDGTLRTIEPYMNAIIVQVLERPQEDGSIEYSEVVSIMCKDAHMEKELIERAQKHLPGAALASSKEGV